MRYSEQVVSLDSYRLMVEDSDSLKRTWRRAHPAIIRLWNRAEEDHATDFECQQVRTAIAKAKGE